MIDLGDTPTGAPPDAGQQSQIRDALGLAIGEDIQAFNAKLATSGTINFPVIASIKSLPVIASGAPADIGSISLPSWLTRFRMPNLTCGFCVTETGTSVSGNFQIFTGAGGTGIAVTVTNQGIPANAGALGFITGANAFSSYCESSTLYIRQTTASSNAGTISVYLMLVPLL